MAKEYVQLPHGAGELAYLDTFAGMVPCKVLEVREGGQLVTVEVTAQRGAYKVGDRITQRWEWVIPRTSVHRRRFTTRIINNYRWVDSCA